MYKRPMVRSVPSIPLMGHAKPSAMCNGQLPAQCAASVLLVGGRWLYAHFGRSGKRVRLEERVRLALVRHERIRRQLQPALTIGSAPNAPTAPADPPT